MKAPTAGIDMNSDSADLVPTRSSAGAAAGGAGEVVVIRGHRVPLAANFATFSMFEESMKAGPVGTFWPPPMRLPFVL